MLTRKFYEYCNGDEVRQALRAGALIPSAGSVGPAAVLAVPDRDLPLNRLIEVQPDGSLQAVTPEAAQVGRNGTFRIGLRSRDLPARWRDFAVCVERDSRRKFKRLMRRQGSNPDRWRVSFQEIPAERWLSVERRLGPGQWQALTPAEIEAMIAEEAA